ncbi:amino acid ABC transporter substrate-binding protein [Sphingomonas oligophenolica]|uniref:Transporter substrate-binding domain-containing protein n=1 Tax=Sphingomonas oligophenolica TaxID=301154 RepID=A0ABU9Y683_9SPHN
MYLDRLRAVTPLLLLVALLAAILGVARTSKHSTDLERIRASGILKCGSHNGIPGFFFFKTNGQPAGLSVDFCRALSIAVFGDVNHVRLVPISMQSRFLALQSGEVDVLLPPTAMSIKRDTSLGLTNVATLVNNGVGFLVSRKLNATSARDLDGRTICVIQGSTMERAIVDYARPFNITIATRPYDNLQLERAAFFSGRCDGIVDDFVALQGDVAAAPDPASYVVLPDNIAKEQDGVMVRSGDASMEKLARWTFYAMVQAEEYGIDQKNVDAIYRSRASPEIRRFLGTEGDFGKALGTARNDWTYQIIRQIGNYGEMFDRSLGKDGLGVDRGKNRLWKDGGMMISEMWQ